MFARIALYEQVDVDNLGPVVAWFQEHSTELNQGLAGYHGAMTLLDRDNACVVGLGLYDSAASAQAVDALMDQGPPPSMPAELQEILARGQRTHSGTYEVVESDGQLSVPDASAG